MESDSANYKEADTETDNPVISVMVSAMSVQVYRVTVADQEQNLCQIGSEMSSKQSMNTRSPLFSIVSARLHGCCLPSCQS